MRNKLNKKIGHNGIFCNHVRFKAIIQRDFYDKNLINSLWKKFGQYAVCERSLNKKYLPDANIRLILWFNAYNLQSFFNFFLKIHAAHLNIVVAWLPIIYHPWENTARPQNWWWNGALYLSWRNLMCLLHFFMVRMIRDPCVIKRLASFLGRDMEGWWKKTNSIAVKYIPCNHLDVFKLRAVI